MKKLLSLLLFLPIVSMSQGVKFEEGLSWEQIKQKAKQENKYIFLDCYTTWCPPCKKMDEVVYPDKTVADYFNNKFISVKVQMDKTKKDDVSVQSWYHDAEFIGYRYHIDAYPTFIFLSPQGTIVEKDMGFKDPPAFVTLAQGALKEGKVYHDPYEEYNQLVTDYNKGIKHYDKMVEMINIAQKFRQNDLAQKLLNDHIRYVTKLPKKKRYTRDAVTLWSRQDIKSSDPQFQFFYKDGAIIDKVMETEDFSAEIVDNTILKEIINPFFKEQPGGSIMVQQGMGFMILDQYGQPVKSKKEPELDKTEANWEKLEKVIRKKFNKFWAEREVANARQSWYEKHNNWDAFAIVYLKKIEKQKNDPWLNHCAWKIFLHVTDTNLLKQTIPCVERMIAKYPGAAEIDTYANLLYKVGRQKEALVWESKAAEMAGKDNAYNLMIIEKMKNGEKTW